MTTIRDLAHFRDILTSSASWRTIVQNVCLGWNNTTLYRKYVSKHGLGQIDDRIELVREAAMLLSQSVALKNLHLSIHLGSDVPFAVPRLNSLSILLDDESYMKPAEFPALFDLFQIPTLDRMEINSMHTHNSGTGPLIPETCHRPRISNITQLRLTQCQIIDGQFSHLLAWPKDLQVLFISAQHTDVAVTRFCVSSGTVNMAGVLEALRPLEDSLQDLYLEFDWVSHWWGPPLQNQAFQAFHKLRRLRLPLEMLLRLSCASVDEDEAPFGYNSAPPVHTRFPGSLEELTIEAPLDFSYSQIEGDYRAPSQGTIELFEYLSGLAEYRYKCFPNLSDLSVLSDLDESPLDCKGTSEFVNLMESSGIAIRFLKEISLSRDGNEKA